MKFMQIHPFYSEYLDQFYAERPGLHLASYDDQISAIVADGFGASHIFAAHLGKVGYETFLSLPNCLQTQARWLHENETAGSRVADWQQILLAQIDSFKPDVLYLGDPISYHSSFVRALSRRPALVIGWRAANIPAGTDFSAFDIIVSSSSACREKSLQHGARAVEHLLPGIPEAIAAGVGSIEEQFDLVFCGSWTPEHARRNSYLTGIASAPLFISNPGRLGYFLAGDGASMPAEVASANRGARWGMKMYQALKSGRINFNSSIDLAEKELTNMRMFEISAVGAFQIVERDATLAKYFEPGTELETFQSIPELLEKVDYYLANPEQRRAIADAGRRRCMRDHSMEQRIKEFDSIIRRYLGDKGAAAPGADAVDPYDTAYRWGWENPALRQTVYLCYKTPDFADNARRFHASEEFREVLCVLETLGQPPGASRKVLDIGCGNGVASYSLARSGYAVTAIDSSLGELAGIRAAEKLRGLDGAQFEVRRATSARLEFPDASFDVVWMREVLHHITDLVPFLREVKRVLKPGGVLCCMRDVVIWNEEQRRAFFANHPFYHITRDEGCYYLREYRDAFDAAGLVREKELDPVESVINSYPSTPPPGAVYDQAASMARQAGYDLFSFFLSKPASDSASGAESDAMQRFARLQQEKEARMNAATPVAPAPARPDPADLGGRFPEVSFGEMVQVLGMGNISIGVGSCIGDNSWLNVCIRDGEVRMRIGVCVLVGRQAVISTAGTLEIGDYCVFAPRVYISDADHIYTDIMQPIIQQGATWNRSVVIEENCWLGINTVISGNLTLGRGSVVGANAVVTRDIPPFSVVVGNPAQVVKMYSTRSRTWERTRGEEDIRRILKEREEDGLPSREQYRQILRQNAQVTRLDPVLGGRGNII